MKKQILTLALVAAVFFGLVHMANGQTGVGTLDPFKYSTGTSITTRATSSSLTIPSLGSSNLCLRTNASGTLSTVSCGSGGSGYTNTTTTVNGINSAVILAAGTSTAISSSSQTITIGLITNGNGNQYLNGNGAFGSPSTTNVTEGTNLYFTQARLYAPGFVTGTSTAFIANSASSSFAWRSNNLSDLAATSTARTNLLGSGTGVQYLNGLGLFATPSTTDITEGTNLYFTGARLYAPGFLTSTSTAFGWRATTTVTGISGAITLSTTTNYAGGFSISSSSQNIAFNFPKRIDDINNLATTSNNYLVANGTTWTSQAASTTNIAEGTNLYFTQARLYAPGFITASSTGQYTTTTITAGGNMFVTNGGIGATTISWNAAPSTSTITTATTTNLNWTAATGTTLFATNATTTNLNTTNLKVGTLNGILAGSGGTVGVVASSSYVASLTASSSVQISGATGAVNVAAINYLAQAEYAYTTSTSNWDDVFWIPKTTSTIKAIYGVNSVNGDTVKFNVCWANSRTNSSSTSNCAFTSFQTLTATTTPSTFAINGSSTVGLQQPMRIIANTASSSESLWNIYYDEN